MGIMKEISVKALAKINLGLDVVRRREDGYHEVKMVMQTIHLFDRLEMKKTAGGITMTTNLSFLPTNENNLVYKAAKLLMDEVINYAQKHKMLISLETHNPNNVPIYEHFGFKTYGIVETPHFDLKQYCMIREATV